MNVNIQLLDDRAVIPEKMSESAACYDLTAFDGRLIVGTDLITYRTGLAFEVPEGFVMKIYPRSSLYKKYGLKLANQVGIVDSDYRGEVVLLLNYDKSDESRRWKSINKERLAQFEIVEQSIDAQFKVVDKLSDTARGSGGFGSTGV